MTPKIPPKEPDTADKMKHKNQNIFLFFTVHLLPSIHQIAENAEKLSESSKTQSDIAIKTSKKADIKGWIAVIISVLTFIMKICDRIGLF